MRKIDRLRKEALQSCKARGHVMGRFQYGWHGAEFQHMYGIATCKVCGAYAGIDSDPWPNGIDIGGPAVAVDCEVKP